MSEFFKFLLQLILGATVVAAVIAGLFRVYASKRSQARREARAAIDEVRRCVDDVQERARSYYTLAGFDPKCTVLGLEIRGLLQKIGTGVTVLNHQFSPEDRVLLSSAFRFRQAVSMDLDCRLREAWVADDERFQLIATKGDALLLELERLFARKHG